MAAERIIRAIIWVGAIAILLLVYVTDSMAADSDDLTRGIYGQDPIKINDLGWRGFLERWNEDAISEINRQILRLGHGFLWQNYNMKQRLAARGVLLPDEIYSAEIKENAGEKLEEREKQWRLKLYRDLLEAALQVGELRFTSMDYMDKAILAGSLFQEPATPYDVERAEQSLSTTLPPSYKAFLKESNGWLTDAVHILPASRIGWLKDMEKGEKTSYYVWDDVPSASDDRYFVYNNSQDPLSMRVEYMKSSLVISYGIFEGKVMILLNPNIRFGDEWEAQIWDSSIPGVIRFRSFGEMMEFLYVKDMHTIRDFRD